MTQQTTTMGSAHEHREGGRLREPGHYREGPVAMAIERRTARLPSDVFLWAAGTAIGGSLALHILGRKSDALFVGHWAPTLLCLGLYNKIVKTAGHGENQ